MEDDEGESSSMMDDEDMPSSTPLDSAIKGLESPELFDIT